MWNSLTAMVVILSSHIEYVYSTILNSYKLHFFCSSLLIIYNPTQAVEGNSVECLQLLLSRGANVNAYDRVGDTAVHYAAERGHKVGDY